jgi:hypothetical protein
MSSLSMTKDEIKDKIAKYSKKSITDINIKTHVRYFSAVRDSKTHKIKYDSNGDPKITFKNGGFLKKKMVSTNDDGELVGYVILRNKPVQDTKSKAMEWSVPVCDTTTFYAIKPPKSKDEIYQKKFDIQQKEIDTLKSQLSKLRKSKSKKDRTDATSTSVRKQ